MVMMVTGPMMYGRWREDLAEDFFLQFRVYCSDTPAAGML
jgi:hypothetical protein